MTKPTRDRKRWRVGRYIAEGRGPDEVDQAILADYAPLSAERRTELEARRRYLSRKSEQYTQSDAVFYKAWLAEIDAELEGQ